MKKYVLAGCGSRGISAYAIPMVKDYADCACLCGVYDINKKRAALAGMLSGTDVPVFEDFENMLDSVKPDTVIICTKDCSHDFYIIKALEHGCDVISEKPVTTTFEKALAINKAREKYGKEVRVTFNLRFHPFFKRVKEIVAGGAIGDILSVHYEWMLDTRHGADYFRRWHRQRENSGSLLIHKSTHHFDIVNWLLDDEPESVNAFGTRSFYGNTRSERGERCLSCPHKKKCEFYWDIETAKEEHFTYKQLYLDCEDDDGYIRDGCVFSDEIDIEDSVSVNVKYKKGAVMSYSLTAHSPYEGLNLVLNGTLGRMEIRNMNGDLRIYNRNGEAIVYNFPRTPIGGHGGADSALLDNLFRGCDNDHLNQMADLRCGMMSIGIGAAANISMAENRRVYLDEFYKDL